MYSVRELVRILGLQTETQVRNRIEAIRDLLSPHLHRGPNNRILVDERGLELLRALQDLCERGKTVKEAAQALRGCSDREGPAGISTSPPASTELLLRHLEEEIRFLRDLLLKEKGTQTPWWERWRTL